jgi:hypothetical protein
MQADPQMSTWKAGIKDSGRAKGNVNSAIRMNT